MNEQEMRQAGDQYAITEARDVAHAVDLILCDRQAGEFTIGIEPLRALCAGLRAAVLSAENLAKQLAECQNKPTAHVAERK